jgi:hypothetical protein
MNFLKHYGKPLFLTAIFIIGTIYIFGCSKKDNPSGPDGNNLVCNDGEAWIKTTDGVDGGYIFTADNDMIAVAMLPDGTWHGTKVGTYTAKDGKLTTVFASGGTITETYNVSGGKLTLIGKGGTDVYTKRNDVYVK